MDAIFGMPFGGSMAFLRAPDKTKTIWRHAGEGAVVLTESVSDAVQVQIESAGFLDGDYAKLIVNGRDLSPNAKGINILVVNPETLDAYVGVFDTFTVHSTDSHLLIRFLENISASALVLLAVRFDAARRLHPLARTKLRELGLDFPIADDATALQEAIKDLAVTGAEELLTFCGVANAPKCARFLAENGWDIDFQKDHGSKNTPLLDAVFHGSVSVVQVLLSLGADTRRLNKWSESAADIALKLYGFASLEEMAGVSKSVPRRGSS